MILCVVFLMLRVCLLLACWERADLLAIVGEVYCIFDTFPCGILGKVCCLIVSLPDVCRLSYFARLETYRGWKRYIFIPGSQTDRWL